MDITSRIKNHPTVLMFRLLVGLELDNDKQKKRKKRSSASKSFFRRPHILVLGIVLSLFLLAIFFASNTSSPNNRSRETANSPIKEIEKATVSPILVPTTTVEKSESLDSRTSTINESTSQLETSVNPEPQTTTPTIAASDASASASASAIKTDPSSTAITSIDTNEKVVAPISSEQHLKTQITALMNSEPNTAEVTTNQVAPSSNTNEQITATKTNGSIVADSNSMNVAVVESQNIAQINSQRIDKLEQLLLQEQAKNKELYLKLSKRDSQLQEFKEAAMKEVKIDSSDKEYIAAITKAEDTSVVAEKELAEIDYYNKVRVLLKNELGGHSSNRQNVQLQKLVNQLLDTKDKSASSEKKAGYIASLEKESVVRSNEVRSIVLKKNETLWGLAKRAYGDGMLYKKIIKANPQITEENARFLLPGTTIRIPE